MADNRYYYFKDAKGNRHTVDKTAYDKDPMGFAKAFPGARMEVIDRKTGRRGDVSVKDASRVGDFGAHLFTGRTITRGKGDPNSSALGRAQQSVAQEKWGGGVVTHENTTASENVSAPKRNAVTLDDWNGGTTGKESELVKGLRAADMIRKRDEEQMPIDYTKPGAVKQMVKRTRERQHIVGQNVEQAGREFTNRERDRRNAPAFDLGNEDVNNNIVKTRGQLEDELEESSRQLVDKQLGGYINNSIQKMFKDATVKGVAAEDALSKASPFAYMAAGKAYNEALDPDKLMNQLSKNAEKDMAGLFSDPKMQKEIAEKAASFGIDPEDYVKNYIAPGLQAKIAEEFEKSELSRNMPKSTAEYIIRGVNDSMIGTILSMGMMSKKQRQYAQQGMAMTDKGENPYVKPGMGARVARGTLSFGADAPVFGVLGKGGAAVAGKAFGNGVAQAARIANTSLAGRIGRMVGTGAVSQGVTGVLYGSTNAAVQNYSTGDDTSIGNTVKLMTMGGLSEGASWATMGGIGGAVGAGIYNVSGVKRIPAKVFQIAMEGWGMHVGGNVAKMIEGHDTDFWSVEGTLEACANVVALKLTHARLPKRQVMDGKKESYLDMVARNIKNLMTSDGQRAAFGGYTFTNEEKEQLFGSDKAPKREETLYGYDVHDNPLTRKESLTSWAMRTKKTAAKGKGEESYKDTDAEFVKTAYDEIMADNTIPWDTKAKFSALVMGTVPSARPMMEYIRIEDGSVNEYSKNGELLSKNSFKTSDERDSILYSLNQKSEDQRLNNAYGVAQIKDEKAAQETLETVAKTFGLTAEEMKAVMGKDPLKRSEGEQNACVALRKAYEGEQFPEGTLHPDQSQTEGKDVVEENNLGTENPNNEAVAEVLNNMNNAEKAFNAALESNDVLKQEYERLTKEGLSEPQIYMELINSGLTQEQLAPFADYINAKAKAVGMYRGTEQKIAETVQKHVEQWSYKGELNGEKQDGGQMLFVKDNNGRLLIVGAGDVAFDSEGRARESVGDMISVLDPNTKEMDFVSKKDVQLDHVEKTEDYAKNYQTMLEELNSTAYAESEKGKEKSEESDTKPSEASLSLPKPGEQPKGEDAPVPVDEDVKPIGEGGKKNPSDNGNGSNETLTFADGTPVPMMKDTKGRETADYSQMTPEHGAEWMSSQFGENAEAAVDGQIKRAEKMLKEAEMIKVDYTGDLNDAKEAEAQKAKAVDAAKAELELYTNIKKVMTANKVKAGIEKVGSAGEEGSVSEAGNLGAVREKFESGKRIVGNKRTRTLADGSKLRGHYEIVEADSLTPSHNANDGYKKSEGFPVNEEGRTINDRDYENDKQAQLVTDMIAMKYDGQAVDQVPVVTSDGIVVDGNGRTMAGQKAAKNGTDSAYLEALKENAENYGFTAEQIEQSGIKHPRLVLVSDEPMKYDTATFAKFNKNEKKSQGNTQQAVANSKKLSADEIGTIISEIEGSGSLDAFFNNPTAINSLLKRLIDKGVIGLNEVAGLREGEDKLSAAGKDFVKNLLLGSVFSENTIRMMGADAMLKTKALNGIRAVTDNMKLGDYALMKEIDQAVQLLYEARQGGSGVDAYLRTPAMFGENAADRFDPISQAIALALEGKVEDFRELMMAYNRNAAPYADANQTEMFGERPTKEDFVNEFLKLKNWKDYETRHSSKEGNGDVGGSERTEPQARGGNVITSEADYNKAVEQLKEAKGEERERILDQMGEYVKEFAKSNGYDEPVVLRTKQDLADAAKTENDKTIIENMPEGAHYPGYYEDGKIYIYLEGSTGSEELRETFEHESVHADNEVDPSRVEALVYSITDMNTLTREELERVVEVLSNMKEYTERASEMNDVDALYMLADEALAHLVTYAQEHGKDAMSEITDNPTLLNIAEISLKERENDRRRKEGLAKSGDKTLERKNIDDVSTEENGGALEGDKEGKPGNDNGGSPDRDVQATEEQREVDKAVKRIATEITKKTGIEVVTDEKEAEGVIRESEETDSDLKYHKETDEAILEELENGETVKVYRAMQVIDGKLYPPMAAAVNGKRVEANELGVWIRADENPDLAIPDIDPKTKEQKVDKKTGELKWKFKLDKGGKDATGKKATDIPAAYNPYWHTSRSPLNDQFKSAWIRPNIVVVECEVPVSELSSGYRAERAKDAVGEVDWKSGVVSGEVYKQTGRARKVILSRWCKPVRVLSDAEVAQRAKEFVGDAKVEIPENVLTPRQRIEFEKVGFKIGAPEKGVKKSDQINEALKRGLQIDNSVKEFRTKDGEVYGFTDGEKIYLDTKKMKPETPLHEYAHLWCDMLRKVNPNEWENVKKLFDKVESLKEEVKKLYPELKDDALYEEMITTYSGREGTKKLEDVVRKLAAEEGKSVTESAKAQGFLEKVKVALTKYWKGVADVLGIHFTTAEEVADKVLADWAKGVDPRGSEEGRVKSEESDSKVEGVVTPKGDIKDATAPKGEKTKKEPSKTNPLAWLAHTAEMYKDEQVQKAKEELAKAKESGDASDIKRATADMKQAMETKLRGNGIGLVERRRIIGREIGKILGEEVGKAEAEKIDKPWEQMDLEEREAVSSKNPLTETEINELTSEENRELIPAALAYLRGDKGNIINAISYFKIWNDVRSRHENVPDNSGTKDGTQLDAPNTGGSQELGLGRGREGGGPNGPVDRTDGERTTPGERESGTGGENDTPVSTGKPRVDKGEGNTPGMDAVSAGSTDTRGGGGAGNEGNVPKRGGQGGGNGPLDPNAGRKPAAKQGTHFPDSTSERLKQERAEYEQKKKDFWERWKKAGQGYMKISLTPFKALNLSPEQIEMLPELFKMHLNGAVLKIKEGIYKFNEWKAAMRAEEGEELKMIGLSDEDIDRFIEDYWNTPYQMDGETHTIGEWAGIHGNEKLREKLSEPLNDKYQRQIEAEPIKVKIGDKKNIEETLPYLLPQQQEDVLKAETQFFGNEHADREHAYGKGYMFTNGTGTGKTFTGLGIAKRLVKQGKGRILIVTPSQKKVSDWIKDGRNLNMEIRDLDSIAKERGTTATTESGEGVVITTFANFGVNKKLLETKWDAVIYDESHRIMENKNGAETARSMQHYMMTNRSENHCFLRLQETNADYQKMKSLSEQFNAERDKEVKRIQDEYKASHPSATARDISYATSKALPKEIINFTPGDYASFPKLGEIHSEFKKAFSHYINEVMPKLEAQAKSEWKDTKTIFLSATPFNTRENLDYVEGYIFKYPEEEKGGRMSGRTQFYLDHFGAAYKFRYGRLEQSTSNPEAVAKQEIAFSDYLQHTLGTMSGRIIDSPYDYSRDFPTVSPDHAEEFNQAVQDAVRGHGVLADAYRRTIGDYNYGSALFETMKVANIIERIKAHLDAGRKVVIFHRRVETKEPLKPPFALMLEQANHLVSIMSEGEEKKEAAKAVRDFRKKYADLLEWEQTLDYSMPREQIAKVFGKDKVLFFSGKESSKVKDKAVDTFNDDDSGKNIIVIQEASGKEGISLHDTTGKHQRVCITLALPQSPITALQIEGRTYRIGNKSNAIFEYPILGLNSEMMLFGEKFNNQVSTTENLALGSQARSLRDSFAKGILEHSGVVPIEQQGVGGKEFDAPKEQDNDPFDSAVLDYYSNHKLNSRNREGVDYFPTPEPLGYKMMEWANMGEGDTVLEPSAGHGAIARYAPKGNQMVAIEPSQSLFTKLQLKAGGLGRKFQNTIFENYDISNKHDVVVMNPPFGTAGATAIAHLGKAFKHLEEGGRVVALIPRGSTDKKFEKWINGEKTAVMRAEVELPDIVFKQAGTNVVCRVVVVDKISNEAMRAKAGRVEKVSLGGHYDKIEDFFEDLRDIEMPDRIIDTKAIMMKKSKQTAKDLKELKNVTVDFNEGGINVRVRGDWKDYSIPFDMDGYSAEQKKKFLASTYETFEQQERQTRNETSQAVLAELKKLTCKLADMTEEEMQRYLKKKYEGKGVMENIAHSAEVYNNAKKLRFQKAPKEEQSEELYLSLQNKKGKEYYDTVDILSERIADGRADIRGLSERPGRKEANRISAGIEIIAASRDRQNEAGTAKSNETKLRLGRVATEKAIEEWAKSNDAVFAEEDIAKGAMDGKPSAEGGEAVVYVSNDFSKVTKLVDPYPRNNGSIQLCMENTRLFNRLFPDAAYTVKGVARDKNGKFRIVMEQPYLEGKQYSEDTMAEYENGPSQAKDALMESLGLHDVYGDGLEFRNDKYYVSDLHPGNIVFDSEGQPHVIDADVKYYGVFRRDNIEGKPLIVDNEAKEPKADTRNSEELFKSLKDKEGKEYYDTVTELAERMAGRTGRKEESVSEGQSQPRETSVGRNTERIVGRPKSVVHCAAEIIATDTERSYGNGGLQQSERGLERGEKNALVPREKSSQSEVSTAGVWENRVSDPVEREISKRIEDWAKQTNHWFDWRSLRTKYDRTKQLGDGTEAESDVFLSKDGKTVLKVVRNPHALYTSLLGKLNSIALHNKLFGDVGQTIIGITRTTETDALGKDVSTIGLLIEQPFVEGKPVADAFNNYGEEIAYIDKTMTDLGFKPEKWADNGGYFNGEPETVWRKDDVIVYDTHGNNIFIDKNGKPRLIDCGIETYKDYAKRHTKYDSTKAREAEYENAVRAVKSEIRALEKEVLNEERLIAMLRDNRREDNADKIDGFIKYHEEKIAELKHKIRINAQALQKPNSVHYRTDASLSISKPLEGRIAETVEKVSKQTGGKVKMVNSVEEIENPKVRKDIENGKQVTGWYDEKTGEVHLYMPNIHDTYTAEKTVWHETVGHKGMRGLLGDKFNDYMRSLWMDLDNPINAELRAYVKEKMNMNHLGFYDAIEEFIAKSAEDGKGEPGFWNYIKNKVTDALHEIGYRVSPNVKDVKYMLWLAKNVQKHGDSPLWKMRAEAVRWKIEHEKTSSVVEENGMMYDNNGKKHGLLDLNKKDFDEATDGHVHYRTSPMTASKIEEYNRRLSTKWYAFKESTVDDMQSLQEAMQIISGVKDAYADIPSAFNPLQCHNRMGSMVMQMCERYDREYTEPLGDAFKKVVSAMPGKDGAEQTRNANLYFIKKHGLERNRVLFVRDKIREERKVKSEESDSIDALETAWKDERSDLRRALDSGQIDLREYYRQMDEWIVRNIDKDFKAEEHDYSGMHGIYDVKKGEEYDDANVIDEVMSTESQLGADLVKSFWDAKKKATDFTIDQEYANGFKDKKERDHLKEMFDWYVPLRKFDDTVAEDVYGYISGDDTKNDIGSVIEKARGRESLSDVNVLAQISALAKSSILNGGKNVERQHFMRFVEAYEKGDAKDRIFVEIQPWVEKHTVDGNEVWEEVMPNIPENSTQDQINEILNTFEDTMKAKQAHGEAKIARRKSDIGYKFERSSDMNQHIVNVYVNGRVRRFVCQGNPRAAQAINGMLRDSGTRGWVSEKSAELNRYCAQLNTSLNPDFLSSNLMRDLTFVSANLTKEGMGYTWDFCMEYAKNWASMARRKDGNFDGGYLGMFRRYKDGRLDANNQKERWFKEFMDNGGETGFVSLKKYEDIIKEYENLVKTGNKDGDRWLMKKLKEGGALIELANEVVENVARYSTYCVSRKRGRSIGKSIYDAKEVSSNFNRHGSGDAIKSLKTEYDGKTDIAFRNSLGWFNSYMKNHTMFYNAGVQGANLFTKNLKHAPKTAAIAFGAMPFGLNIAVALLNQLLISQEDEKKRNGVKNPYAELPEWKRRNNLCIYWGGGKFKTIPMGIELRAFYGLGDIAAGYMVDESLKSDTPIGMDIIGQMAQLVPASDFLGHHSPSSGIKELGEDVILSVIPTTAKPELELAFNRDWTGRPIYRDNDYLDKAPRWKRAYDSTNDAYMTINKWANKTFNGIDNTNEGLKGSGMLADAVDFFTAPYGLQHIVEGYTGGAGATIGRTYQTGKSLVKGVVSGVKNDKGFAEGFNKEWDKVNPNTIPFYRVFNYTPKEGNDMQRTKSKWYNYADELEQLKYNMQQMKTNTPDTAKNIHNAASKFKVSQSKEGRMLKIYEAADRYITAKRRILKRAKDKAVVEAVNEAINRKMQEAVADLDKIE